MILAGVWGQDECFRMWDFSVLTVGAEGNVKMQVSHVHLPLLMNP